MVIIAFSEHTSKVLPRIFCRRFRHVAPIFQTGHDLVMYQFVRPHCVEKIHLHTRDIAILRAHGWQFIFVPIDVQIDFNKKCAKTCVDLSKRALGINNIFIQTPYALYKYITRK